MNKINGVHNWYSVPFVLSLALHPPLLFKKNGLQLENCHCLLFSKNVNIWRYLRSCTSQAAVLPFTVSLIPCGLITLFTFEYNCSEIQVPPNKLFVVHGVWALEIYYSMISQKYSFMKFVFWAFITLEFNNTNWNCCGTVLIFTTNDVKTLKVAWYCL